MSFSFRSSSSTDRVTQFSLGNSEFTLKLHVRVCPLWDRLMNISEIKKKYCSRLIPRSTTSFHINWICYAFWSVSSVQHLLISELIRAEFSGDRDEIGHMGYSLKLRSVFYDCPSLITSISFGMNVSIIFFYTFIRKKWKNKSWSRANWY